MLRTTMALVGAGVVLLGTPLPAPRGEVLDIVTPARVDTPVAAGTASPSPAPGRTTAPEAASGSGRLAGEPGVDRRGSRQLVAEPAPPESLRGYEWPLAHPRLTLPFGPTPWGSRVVDGRTFHDGVDLATFCGDKVRAAHSGTVLAAGRHYDDWLGWVGDLEPYYERLDRKGLWQTLPIVVVVDDGNGYRSVYAHFARVVVRAGDTVDAGDLLGFEGMTGRASGCHVHYTLFSPLERATFGIRRDVARRMRLPLEEVARIDPLLVLPPRRGINTPLTPASAPHGLDAAEPSPSPAQPSSP